MPIVIKTPADIEGMRLAGRLAAEVLDFITPHVQAGVTTGELDRLCHDYMVDVQGTVPAPLNYAPPGYRPFPKSICTSVNHQVCHGIPGDRVLKNGDVLNIDITVIKDGYHGDTSRMFFVGEPSIGARRLCEVTYECMWLGIQQVRPGATIGDIGHAIQTHAEKNGFSVVREFCGHGIGTQVPRGAADPALRQARHAREAGRRHDLHRRAHDQRRPPRDQGTGRRLDHRDQGPQPVGAVGAHGPGHADRLRGADGVGRLPAAPAFVARASSEPATA